MTPTIKVAAKFAAKFGQKLDQKFESMIATKGSVPYCKLPESVKGGT